MPKIVVVAGPTASGKTAVGIRLAERFSGEIVSADSVQVYRYLDIGSAKPTAEERERIAHHMIDIRDPDEEFSAGDYVREARATIGKILQKGRVPFVVGGTGLYIRSLLGGMADLPPAQPALRSRMLEAEADSKGTLFARLEQVDPATARSTPPDNIPRIIRALEVFEVTGKTMSQVQEEHGFRDRPYGHIFICLSLEKSLLYERIDKRVDSMIEGGLLEEVVSLYERGYSPNLNSMQSLGYRHIGMILSGQIETQEAIRLMKRDTRHYAKRQLTWFRSEPGVLWCDPEEIAGIGLMVTNFLER
ncbi:MAG: tRNA (adenosine(37)-N6)-dimethylallyltransferase MiaA [Desulfomonile tiedjei]|nr:tRNA (adenosine(37)-N6)-dimethylallyltransferase MiaA [Desulfomonile tiedjei]